VLKAWAGPIRHCLDLFGPDRCMFESNFPVDKTTLSYATLWNAFDAMSCDLSASERDALFYDNATRVYRLSDTDDEER
jgi:predicted TIM-barrel fold metal-dependent hydrolase